MDYVGRRIYYEKETGNVILDTGERSGYVVETTIEQDFQSYTALIERVPETVGNIQLEYGKYSQDFVECNSYHVDVSGEEPMLVFSYPDPNEPAGPPIHRLPLSQEVEEIKLRQELMQAALDDLILGGAL